MFSWDCHTTRSASMLFLHIVDIYPLFTVDLSIPWTLRDLTWSFALFLTTFQLTSCKEVLHILWRVSSLIFQANRSWIGGLTLCVNRLFVDCIDRSLSSQPGHFTIQTWNIFWKPLHPFCRSLSLPKVDLLTVVESEEAFTQSSIELFTFPLLILTSCFHLSRDIIHEFTPRINLKNFWPSQWSTLRNFLKSSWDLESACDINNTKSWSRDKL